MFELTSPAFKASTTIPKKFTCAGPDVSPRLAWKTPVGLWLHWVVYDVPAKSAGLPEGVPAAETVDGGGRQGWSWGVAQFERVGYGSPCPPPGPAHRYVFTAYALSSPTGLPPRATKSQLLKAMKDKVLARAELVGLYGR
jgi:Raf kinase inhibitor-like YbhB/YbcL family protein